MNKQQLAQKIWASANQMRSKIEASEYKDFILGFMFYKYLSDKEVEFLKENDYDDELLKTVTDDDEETVRWIQENIGYFISYKDLFSTWLSMGKDFDVSNVRDALSAFSRLISATHKKVFDKVFDTLQTGLSKLGDSLGTQTKAISGLLTLIKDIPMDGKQGYDVLGYIYEYLIEQFAANAGKKAGEFYTPHDVVQLIATMIEPYDGTLYDPCCGSGGMFIQSAELVKSKQGNLNGINIYGQEKEPATYRLAKMNLALRGISHNLGEEADSSFTHDLHKGLHFNYIMANPPFNLKGWYNDNLKNDPRWSDYQTPPESNANYAWILHILSHLKKTDGVAGFLLANGALNDSDTLEIRKELIQNDKIEAIVVLPRELFITTDISVTLWILNQNKKGGKYHRRNLRNREHEMLFMDLRQWTENSVKGESKKKVRLDTEQIEKAAEIYHTWQCEGIDGTNYEIPELYRSVGIDEIENKGWALTPSKYIEFIDHDLEIDYEKEMVRIQSEMKEIMMQEKKSQQMLEEAFRGLGYGID